MRETFLDTGWTFAEASWLRTPKPAYARVPGWLPAKVPGCVHSDLLRAGIIADPFVHLAELGCQWVDQTDWSYRTTFDWTPASELPTRTLLFEGLDTICTITLNGAEIARSDNMFLPLEVDVTHLLRGGSNDLRIDFQSAVRIGEERRAAFFAAAGLPDDTANFEERAFIRKAQYMFGWDWGPRLVSCGVWRPIRLLEQAEAAKPNQPRPKTRVELRREKDPLGESFEFIVDGKPLWIRGANWIPSHSFAADQSRVWPLLEQAKAMGMNMLRVWGGGFYESDDFYDICDDLGLLVWQDFPFACSYYPDDEDFVTKVRQEAAYHVKRLRHHPCLAIWCGNNENLTMWEGKWGGADKNPPRFHGERIWNEVLREVVEEHDPGRAYIPTSPIGSPPDRADCNAGGYGDSHYWDVWHGRGDWIHYADSTARFSSEFGFPSSCGLRAWQAAGVTSSEYPAANVQWHDKTGRPAEYLQGLIELHYPDPQTLEEFVYFSQLNQRDAMRFAVEHYRRSDFCKGTLIWQLNDCWPVTSWSLIDFSGELKAAGHEMRRLYADRLICISRDGDAVHIHAVNEGKEPWEEEASVRLMQALTGELIQKERFPIKLGPGERRLVHSLHPELQPTMVWVAAGNATAHRLLCEPKDLPQSPAAPLNVRMETGALQVRCSVPLIDLWVHDPRATFSQNFVSAPPNTWIDLPYKAFPINPTFRSLAGVHEVDFH